jgi:hypothetical protein
MFSVIVFLPQLSFDSQGYKVLSISCSDKELSQLKKRERENELPALLLLPRQSCFRDYIHTVPCSHTGGGGLLVA